MNNKIAKKFAIQIARKGENKKENRGEMLTWWCGSDHDGDNGDDAERRCSRPHSAAAGHIEDPLALNLQGSAPSRSSSFYAPTNEIARLKSNTAFVP